MTDQRVPELDSPELLAPIVEPPESISPEVIDAAAAPPGAKIGGPPDQLVVSGGGSSAVATIELLELSASLKRVHGLLAECLIDLATINRQVAPNDLRNVHAPASGLAAERALQAATAALSQAAVGYQGLAVGLDCSAEGYGFVERLAQHLTQGLVSNAAWLLGSAAPFGTVAMPLLLLPFLGRIGPPNQPGSGVSIDPGLNALLNSEFFVTHLRLLVGSAGSFAGALMHLPPEVAKVLGVAGVSTAIIGAAGIRETSVKTRALATWAYDEPAGGWRERAERIPDGLGQVRIDRYEVAGRPDRFEVYISGTRDFSIRAGAEPADMTSNLYGVAQLDSGAERSVRQAMELAGVGRENPVTFTGHSQGGLVAAHLAGSGDYNAKALFTMGAPAGQVPVPAGVAHLAIEHKNDLVPVTGGLNASTDTVIVRGTGPFDPAGYGAHRIDGYEATSARLDSTTEERVASVADAFDRVANGATNVTSTVYWAERVPSGGGQTR